MFLAPTWIALGFLFATPPPPPTTQEASILAMVPESSFMLVHCEDFAALRSRAERNDWVRLLGSKKGAPVMEEWAREFNRETDTDFDELLALGKELHGESVFFLNGPVAGFLTTASADRTSLVEAMRAWLPEAGPEAVSRIRRLGNAQVELVAWPEKEAWGWADRRGHFAALVDHPHVLGLFSGDDVDSLVATLEASLAGFGTDRRAPVVAGFEAARAKAPRCQGIEAFIDFSPFVAEAERELARAMEGIFPDPTGMLGIDEGLWLHAQSDVFPGIRVDGSAFLNIPQGTLAASLADTFQPLPTDLPTKLPTGIWSLYALRWDLKLFWQRTRAAFEERHGADSLQAVDGGLNAAKSLSGVDPIVDVIEQLEGTFAFFTTDLSDEEKEDDWLDFSEFGLLATLVDGDAFLDAFERAIGGKPFEDELDLIDIAGVDVYVPREEDSFDGGIAFMPREFVFGFGRGTLTRTLRAVTGAEGANLLDGSDLQGALDQNQGCCFFLGQNLSEMRKRHGYGFKSDTTLPPLEGEEQGRDPFEGTYLIHTTRRTPDGFRFELHTK